MLILWFCTDFVVHVGRKILILWFMLASLEALTDKFFGTPLFGNLASILMLRGPLNPKT